MEIINEPKTIDFSKVSEFKTDKHTYKVHLDSMSIDRLSVFQQKEIECLTYFSLSNPIEYQNQLIKELNSMNIVGLGKLLSDQQYLYSPDKSNSDKVLEFCSVFIYREDEDAKIYSEDIAKEKIKDWADFGIDGLSFFSLSIMASQTLLTGYKAYIQSISKEEK